VPVSPRPMCPRTKKVLDVPSLGLCKMHPLLYDISIGLYASLEWYVPWTMRPLDDTSLGRCVPWTMCPLDDASRRRCASWNIGTGCPYAELG
jgi:hypothetical protein